MSGCSAFVRGGNYLTDGAAPPGDGGPRDGGTDSGPQVPLPPIASAVGLSNYRPFIGEELVAFIGPTFDPNGDSVMQSIEWRLNGTPLSGETSNRLTLQASRFSPGDEVSIHVSITDGTLDGDPVRATALIEDDSTTRWRPLLPPRDVNGATVTTFDPRRQRLYMRSRTGPREHGLWERQLTTAGPGPWVRARANGTPPAAQGSRVIWDEANARLLFFFGRIQDKFGADMLTNRWWSLQTSDDGAPAWNEQTRGNEPAARSFPALGQDTEAHSAYLYGGLDEAMGAVFNDVWRLDYGARGSETWTNLGASLPMAVIAPAVIVDRARNRLLVAGGGRVMPGTEIPVPSLEIHALDLANPSAGFTNVGMLTQPVLGAAVHVDADSALMVLGLDTSDPLTFGAALRAVRLDLATLETTSVPLPALQQRPLAWMIPRAPFALDFVVGTASVDRTGADYYRMTRDATSFEPITASGVDMPVPLAGGVAAIQAGALVLSGGLTVAPLTSDPAPSDAVWQWRSDVGWQLRMPPPGSVGSRIGIVMDGSHDFNYGRVYAVLGVDGTGRFYNPDLYLRDHGSGDWSQAQFMASPQSPAPREGHLVYQGGCGSTRQTVLGVAFGRAEDGTLLDEAWGVECGLDFPWRQCVWFQNDAAALEPRAWAAGGLDFDRHVIAFGGLTTTGLTNQVVYGDVCGSATMPEQWRQARVAGTSMPSPRQRHTLSAAVIPRTSDPQAMFLYGGTGDPPGSMVMGDVWRLELRGIVTNIYEVAWAAVPTSGEEPEARYDHVAVYDRTQSRLLVYGGRANEDTTLDDLWELRLR